MGSYTDKKSSNTMVRQADGTYKSQGQMNVEAAYRDAKGGGRFPHGFEPSGSGYASSSIIRCQEALAKVTMEITVVTRC